MYQHRPSRLSRLACAALLAGSLAGWLGCAGAAELGEAVVRSHIGQNLIADIELTGMQDPNVPVLVRLAHPDVYRGANIAMAPVLSHLQLSVMRRDGRQFLHVVSTRPVQAEHLNLFLDLLDGKQRHVRAVTLWLTPDPQPAPPPMPPAAAPVVTSPVVKAAPQPKPAAAPAPAPKPVAKPAPAPAAAPLLQQARAAAPAACPQINPEQLRTCAALDYKNGMLQARIVELEEKVKALQLAIDGRADLAPPPVVKAATQPVMPKPKKVERFPWVLVLVGGATTVGVLVGLVIFLRRKKAMLKGAPVQPGLLSRLKSRFKRADKPAPAPVEPTASS